MGKSTGNAIELMRVGRKAAAAPPQPRHHSLPPSLLQMTVYVFFPVAVFYYFNQPDWFDKRVEEKRVGKLTTSFPTLPAAQF